jgi:DNA-binding transcriptional ArsR family regulator
MNWLDARPEAVVGQADPSDLLSLIRKTKRLSRERADGLDHVFRQWTLRALGRPDDTDGLLELDETVYLASERLEPGMEGIETIRNRWRAFRDLLESKRLVVEAAGSGKAMRLLHAERVLELLEAGPVAQSDLLEKLAVTAPRVSQILGVMEAGGLIRRQRRGKENLVTLVAEEVVAKGLRPLRFLAA